MVGVVIVSHSWKIADGIKDLTDQVAAQVPNIIACGGMADKEIGTDAIRIEEAIVAADQGDGVLIVADLGSGVMSAETAMDLLEDDKIVVKIADAPIVEGAIAAAVAAACGLSLDKVKEAAEQARSVNKIN